MADKDEERGRPVYALLGETDADNRMTIRAIPSDDGEIVEVTVDAAIPFVFNMSPHRAHFLGERLIAIAAGIVIAEDKA